MSKKYVGLPAKFFFASLNGLAAFFTQSAKRTTLLDEFVHCRLPHVCATRWNYSSRLVHTVYQKPEELRLVFNTLLNNADEISYAVLASVSGHLSNLEDFNFCFCLAVFSRIFSHTTVLFSYSQRSSFDIVSSRQKIDAYLQNIHALRGKFEEIYEATLSDVGPPRQRQRSAAPTSDAKSNFRVLFCEIIDNITQHMRVRFSDYRKIQFPVLLQSSKFVDYYRKNFPNESFRCLLSTYGFAFDDVLLKNQLAVSYTSNEFQEKTPSDMLKFFPTILRQSRLCSRCICFAHWYQLFQYQLPASRDHFRP